MKKLNIIKVCEYVSVYDFNSSDSSSDIAAVGTHFNVYSFDAAWAEHRGRAEGIKADHQVLELRNYGWASKRTERRCYVLCHRCGFKNNDSKMTVSLVCHVTSILKTNRLNHFSSKVFQTNGNYSQSEL